MNLLVEFLLLSFSLSRHSCSFGWKDSLGLLEERRKVRNSAVTRRFLEGEGGGGKEDEDRILVCDTGGCVQPGGWVYS